MFLIQKANNAILFSNTSGDENMPGASLDSILKTRLQCLFAAINTRKFAY